MTGFRRLGTERQKFRGLHALRVLSCGSTLPRGLAPSVGQRDEGRVGRNLHPRGQPRAYRADTPTPLLSDPPAATELMQQRRPVYWFPDPRSAPNTRVTLTPGSTGIGATVRQTSARVRNAVAPYHLTSGINHTGGHLQRPVQGWGLRSDAGRNGKPTETGALLHVTRPTTH